MRKEKTEKQNKPKYGTISNTMYMLRYGLGLPQLLLQGTGFALMGVILSVTSLYLTPVLLGILEAHDSLKKLLLTLGGFTLVLMAAGGIRAYLEEIGQNYRIEIRRRIMSGIDEKLGTCSYPLLFEEKFQDKMMKANEATDNNHSAAEAVWLTLFSLLENGLGFVIYLLLLCQVKPFLMLVTLFSAGMGYWITYHFVQKDYALQEESAKAFRGGFWVYNATRNPKLAKDIRIFGMRDWLEGMYRKYQRMAEDIQKRRTKNNILADAASLVLDFLRNGISYAYLLYVTFQGGLSAAEFLLYFTAATGFSAWVVGLLGGLTELHKQSIGISFVREFCEIEEPFCLKGGRELSVNTNEEYCFELRNVTYRYPNKEKPVLEHFTLKLRAGENLAVVGLNGAGKTTMIKLLCGFLDPDEGQVLLNGVDIREYNRTDYYQLFGAVFQDFSVLGGSVAENVAQSTEPDMERVKECLERAGVRARVERLPEGYETKLERKVYPEAVELSGGEMQRLMMARMLFKDAPVMILDEPTAALDALAEQDIYERYNELTKGRSSVYISHRLASTRFCDRVILLGEGGILEEGTHEELMALGGRYAELFEIQSKYYSEGGNEDGE